MHIVLVEKSVLPALKYGGTQRVVWALAEALVKMNHQVTLLCGAGSNCPFARIQIYKEDVPIEMQIPADADIVHFHFAAQYNGPVPVVYTVHGNSGGNETFHPNSIFVSSQHAQRHGAQAFVYNGLNWDDFPKPNFDKSSDFAHFLGHAAWKVKNLKGAIQIATTAHQKLLVLGGNRLSLNMGIKFYPNWNVRFKGMVNESQKHHWLALSRALVFPVLWDEPFGLAITESMYFGNPVFGTPYGSLPELISEKEGRLSLSVSDLAEGLKNWKSYDRKAIHERTLDVFSAHSMALKYCGFYEKVLNGHALHPGPLTQTTSQHSRYEPLQV